MPRKKAAKGKVGSKPSEGMAIAGLVLNILILPGLGSLINERIKEGVWQVLLVVLGVIFIIVGAVTLSGGSMISWVVLGLGIVLAAIAWIWGIITGLRLVKESKR